MIHSTTQLRKNSQHTHKVTYMLITLQNAVLHLHLPVCHCLSISILRKKRNNAICCFYAESAILELGRCFIHSFILLLTLQR